MCFPKAKPSFGTALVFSNLSADVNLKPDFYQRLLFAGSRPPLSSRCVQSLQVNEITRDGNLDGNPERLRRAATHTRYT